MTELSIHCPLLCSVSFIQRTYPYLASSRLPQRIDCIGLLMHSQFLSCRSIICAVSEFLLSAVGAKLLRVKILIALGSVLNAMRTDRRFCIFIRRLYLFAL